MSVMAKRLSERAGYLVEYQPGEDVGEESGPSKFRQLAGELCDGIDPASDLYGAIMVELLRLASRGLDVETPGVILAAQILAEREITARAARLAAAKLPTRLPPLPETHSGAVVYYMQLRDTIKIGFTTQPPERRRKQLAADRVLAVEPGDIALETQRHHQFAHLRVPGRIGRERFLPGNDLVDLVLRIREAYPEIQDGAQ